MPADVIRVGDIDKILDSRARDPESILEWCQRHGVDKAVVHWLATTYGFNRLTQGVAIEAFRLGHEARREDEPRSKSFPVPNGDRYTVEFVVIDQENGQIVGDPSPVQEDAEGIAGSYNEVAAQLSQAGRET